MTSDVEIHSEGIPCIADLRIMGVLVNGDGQVVAPPDQNLLSKNFVDSPIKFLLI